MLGDLLRLVYPIAFTTCSLNQTLTPCGERVKLIATSFYDEHERGDKVTFFPLVRQVREVRVYEGCGNVESPGILDAEGRRELSKLLRARTMNPLIPKADQIEYDYMEGYMFSFAHGKPRKRLKVESGMIVGMVNYFGGLGYLVKCNLKIMRGMSLTSDDIEKREEVLNRAERIYQELSYGEVLTEVISGMGLNGIKAVEEKIGRKIKVERVKAYPIAKEMLYAMKNPLAGEFNAITIGREREVQKFFESFEKLGIPCYVLGKVI
jgi:hypothetical protein